MDKVRQLDEKKQTITRSFRIRKEWDDVLKEESARQGVSVNVLVNKIFRKFSLYSRCTERTNDMSFPPRTLREILDAVQVESLAEAGSKSGALDAINIINALGLPMDYDSIVYMLTEHFGGPHFARWFSCFFHSSGNKDVFHIQHDLGHGWSIYLDGYFPSFLRSIIDIDVKSRVYDYAVTLEVTRPRKKHRDGLK